MNFITSDRVKLFKYFLIILSLLLFSVGATASILIYKNRYTGGPRNSDETDLTTLRLVQLMFRHGDRTPIVQYPKDPLQIESLWPEGFSALTKRGKMKQYKLGEYLRKRYNGFLSQAYSPSEILVHSSDADRAIMSVMTNLAGLFPPVEKDPKSIWNPKIPWQPIPVHTIPVSMDNYINFGADCPRFKELKREYIQRSPFARQINDANRDLYNYLSEHTGLNVTDFEIVSDLYDTLSIQDSNNLTLPEWTKSVYPDKLKVLAPLPFDMRVQVPNEEAQQVKCGPLLTRLVKNMDKMIESLNTSKENPNPKRLPKMYMISGHDSTSSILLGTLGVFDAQFPDFASMAILELHQLPSKSVKNHLNLNAHQPMRGSFKESQEEEETDFYVKVFFRNSTQVSPYEFVLTNCGYPCRVDKFKQLYGNIMIQDEQWKLACKSKEH